MVVSVVLIPSLTDRPLFPVSCFLRRNFKTQDGGMMDGGQSQRWLEEEAPPKKPRVRARERSGTGVRGQGLGVRLGQMGEIRTK